MHLLDLLRPEGRLRPRLPCSKLCSSFTVAAAVFVLTATAASGQAAVRVAATTTMVGDLVRQVGGERVRIDTLMGPGVDPHLYKATASDVRALSRADVIFYSGLMLEGKMQDLFKQMSRRQKILAVTDSIPKSRLLEPAEFAGHPDPHVWFDIPLWAECLETVVEGLSSADPMGAAGYRKRASAARQKMEELHQWTLRKVSELPKEHRILVTSHDAYSYFGRAYGFQVVGLQGISTADEASLADVTQLVDFIRKHGIKAIFVESSVPPQAIERISRDAGVKVGGELFSDAMGTPGQMENGYDLGTYEGMVKHNVSTIVDALK